MYVLPFSKYKEKWMLPFLPEIQLQVLQDDKTEPSIYSKEMVYCTLSTSKGMVP